MTLKPAKAHVEYLLAGVAFFVSVCTLFVYIYQARMMREQQRVSVWPYVEFTYSNALDYHLSVKNKGVGPAIIRRVEIRLDGKVVENNRALVTAVMGSELRVNYLNSDLEGRVLAPGEEIIPFRVPDPQNSRDFYANLRGHTIDLRITYCSIYGDCWECTSGRVERRSAEHLRLY